MNGYDASKAEKRLTSYVPNHMRRLGTWRGKEVIPMQAYCLKCRTQREMKDAKPVQMKNGKAATQGSCPVCGTKMYRIGKG